MDVVTAGTTQTQQAAGKTNHTPEDVSDLRLNIIKKASGKKGSIKYQLAGMQESSRIL